MFHSLKKREKRQFNLRLNDFLKVISFENFMVMVAVKISWTESIES